MKAKDKFKEGDVVRRVGKSYLNIQIGQICHIYAVGSGSSIYIKEREGTGFDCQYFELARVSNEERIKERRKKCDAVSR